jgi:eukaryotic-like serine/threonine-protein kinase
MAGPAAQYPEKLGPYELVRHLATGGMAEVYLARRDGPHGFTKTVALKRILPQLVRDPDFVAMFIDEARVCAQLSHPNLVQVFDFGEAGSELYMAMEYVDGTTCAKLVRRAAARYEMVPFEAALHIVLGVLRGLEYAHAAVDINGVPLGLVHRDVSPGNILIARSGAVKLGDFGIARADEFERRTEEGQLKGKLGYMSPEQVTGRIIDARSDLFTLTIVLAEILTARPLFGTGSELEVLMKIRDVDLGVFDRHSADFPEELRDIVRKGLSQDPSDRFQSATAYADAIEDFTRSKRLSVGAPRLVSWLEHTGLISANRSGEHSFEPMRPPLVAPVDTPAPMAPNAEPVRRRSPLGIAIAAYTNPPKVIERREPSSPSDLAVTADQRPVPRTRIADSDSANISPAIYRVAKDNKVLGPISYAKLIELFATGLANADTLVAREKGPFRPARDLTELARLLVSAALTPVAEAADSQKDTWEIDRAAHPGRIFDLALRKETGLLVASQEQRRKKFFLVDGAPTFTTSTDKRELLGEQLVARGMVLPMEVDMALALCPRYGGRLGDALVGLGVLRPVELFRALVAQTQERFIDVVSWSFGCMEFIRGVRAEGETILHGASPLELIARGILQGYTDENIDDVLGDYLESEIRPVADSGGVLPMLRLGIREGGILTSIERPIRLRQIVEESGDRGIGSRSEVLRSVFIGLSARLLVTTGWPPTLHRPSIPTRRMM